MSDIYAIADAFLRKDSLEARKIQYLCYYFKAWSLVLFDADYLQEYDFYVTEYGPINDELLDKFDDIYTNDKYIPDKGDLTLTTMERQLIENIWTTYSDFSTDELMFLIKSEPPYLLASVGNHLEKPDIDEYIRPQHMLIFYRSQQAGENLPVEKYYPPYEDEWVNEGRVRLQKKEGTN